MSAASVTASPATTSSRSASPDSTLSSKVAHHSRTWRYNRDPATDERWEPIDDQQVDFVYRNDPGWYLHSFAGSVYHLMRIYRIITVVSTTPMTGTKVTNANPDQVPAWYCRVYRRWFAHWEIPGQVVKVLFEARPEHEQGWGVSTRFMRGLFNAQEVLCKGGSVHEASDQLSLSLRNPVIGELDWRWSRVIAFEDRHHQVQNQLPPPGPIFPPQLPDQTPERRQNAATLLPNLAEGQLPQQRVRNGGTPSAAYGSFEWYNQQARRWRLEREECDFPSPADYLAYQDYQQVEMRALGQQLSRIKADQDRADIWQHAESGAFLSQRTRIASPADSGYDNSVPLPEAGNQGEAVGPLDEQDPLGLGPERDTDMRW